MTSTAASGSKPFSLAFARAVSSAPQVVKDDQHGDQRQERNTGPAVEDEAFCQQHCIFGAARHQIIQQQGKRQEENRNTTLLKTMADSLSFGFVVTKRPLPNGSGLQGTGINQKFSAVSSAVSMGA